MKKLLLFGLMVFGGLTVMAETKAEEMLFDFESVNGDWYTVDVCGVQRTSNPSETGLNLSCTVLQIARGGGNNWAGGISSTFASPKSAKYVHILMYREGGNTHQPNLKVSDTAVGGVTDLAPISGAIKAGEWQDVVFKTEGYSIDFIFIMPDRQSDATIYVDDILLSDSATPRTAANKACERPEPGDDGYVLVWNEEFTDGSSLDSKNWNIETTANPANNELQYYSDRGVSIEKDPKEGKNCLVLTARKENLGGRKCTSGRVTTQGKTTFQYGKIVARIWFPNTSNGLWPAFWMMGDDINSVSWPACGETDIIELGNKDGFSKGTQDRYFNGASHWGPRWDQHYQSYNAITYPYSVEDGFHTFTCIWTEDKVSMYVDLEDHPKATAYYERNINKSSDTRSAGYYFHKPNFILLNLAIGGDFPGIYDVNNITALAGGERKMYIDWVRVYQKQGEENLISGSGSDEIEGSTALYNTSDAVASGVRKMIKEGKLVIERGDATYDVLGNKY